jgi:ATP/ADP translocase
MGRFLASIFGLRREEREISFLMALYHFILLITLYLLKPVRDSLFLSERGAEELPFVFILTTIAIVPIAALHSRAGRKLHVGRLLDGVSLFLVVTIIGLRGLIALGPDWGTYVLYAWVSIYGLVVTSQFWLLANAVFAASQAKRVFTALSVGAILGAVAGGEITGLLVDALGMASPNLLWVTAGLLLFSIGLVRFIRYRHRELGGSLEEGEPGSHPSDQGDASGALSIIRDSRHIQFIVGVIALTVITTTFIDFQFKTVASQAYAGEGELTTFMGRFYGRVSLVALFVQFVIAPRLMKIVGIGGALSILPLALGLGTVGMLVVPGLVAGVLLRGADQSLKHSIDKTGREILFVPVSLEKKKRVKVFLDLFVDQGAQGLGGVLLLLFTAGLGLSVQGLSWVVLGMLVVWGCLAIGARASYVEQFRQKLRQQKNFSENGSADDRADREDDISDDLDQLLQSLCSHSETEALRALDQLEDSATTVPVDAILCLLEHPAAAVREHAIRVLRLRDVNADGVAQKVVESLTDPDPDVQLEAARYLYCHQTSNRLERLQEALQHDDVRIQAAAVGLIASEGGAQEQRMVTEPMLRRLMDIGGDAGEDARTHVARLLGVLDRPYRNDLLRRLLRDGSMQVQRAAVEAAGETEDRAFVYPLVVRLQSDALQREARRSLAQYGRRILGTLHDFLVDPSVALPIRKQIPAILADQPCQLAVTVLEDSLSKVPIPVRHSVIRALSTLHAADDYEFDFDRVEQTIREEAKHFAALGQILHLRLRTGESSHPHVDPEMLRRLREESLERIFRLLGLRYDQRDIYDAYLGITSAEDSLRSSAVEFVDNLVEYSISKYLLPLLDDSAGRQATQAGPKHFDQRIRQWSQATAYMEAADDPRLTAMLDAEADAPAVLTDGTDAHGDGHPGSVPNELQQRLEE